MMQATSTPFSDPYNLCLGGGTTTSSGSFGQVIEKESAAAAEVGLLPEIKGSGGGITKSLYVIATDLHRKDEDMNDKRSSPCDLHEGLVGVWLQCYLVPDSGWLSEEELEKATQAVACEHEEECGSMLVPLAEDKCDRMVSSFVALNSGGSYFVYCLGGGHCGSEGSGFFARPRRFVNVLCTDNNTWTSGPSMLRARITPASVVVDDKIYVFGGVNHDTCHPDLWAEVLDTKALVPVWSRLPRPPMLLEHIGLFAVVVDDGEDLIFGMRHENEQEDAGSYSVSSAQGGKTILLGSSFDSVLLLYILEKRTWQVIPAEFGLPGWAGPKPVAVGHMLFWLGDYFYAYDLRQHLLYGGVIRGLGFQLQSFLLLDHPCELQLNHLDGEDFCLTWCDWFGDFTFRYQRLHTTVVRVHLYTDRSPDLVNHLMLDAFVVSSRSHIVPHRFGFESSFLLDRLPSEGKNLGVCYEYGDLGNKIAEENALTA
ncbi:hypothetical protein RHMOL_Rhmol10G0198100 [Rhododendron molle]|uniref:Uncharacterized protein n=2 Tax=Rhododendron molle TaxID=49168 RepID=A0ACC0M456_RHOML|nr:hypothetical protein RHMOL_Rhmol10G0198100 [Rhododendron molle]KAI8535751.1 hypothetical protein RHMOL_Rhmol10G0198100 [Rhododendron molle]